MESHEHVLGFVTYDIHRSKDPTIVGIPVQNLICIGIVELIRILELNTFVFVCTRGF